VGEKKKETPKGLSKSRETKTGGGTHIKGKRERSEEKLRRREHNVVGGTRRYKEGLLKQREFGG